MEVRHNQRKDDICYGKEMTNESDMKPSGSSPGRRHSCYKGTKEVIEIVC